MRTIDYFSSAMKDMHNNFLEAVKDLTDEQLHFRPLDKGHHIAFILWHLVRTEDLVLNFMLQKKTPIWNEKGWDKKLSMAPQAQGTGMTEEQAAAVKITDIGEFLNYTKAVFETSEAYVKSLTEEDLGVVKELPVLGKKSLFEVIGGTTLQHGASHLGEIWYVKGLLGLKGSPV